MNAGCSGFVEADRFGGDDVHQGAALNAGEDLRIDFLGILLLAEDQPAAGPAQGLVGGGGDEIGVGHRAGVQAGDHEPGDVGDVRQQEGADFAGDLRPCARNR